MWLRALLAIIFTDSLIRSFVYSRRPSMLLRHSLALEQEAQGVEAAIENVLAQGYRTPDIAGLETQNTVGTQRMGDLVMTAL